MTYCKQIEFSQRSLLQRFNNPAQIVALGENLNLPRNWRRGMKNLSPRPVAGILHFLCMQMARGLQGDKRGGIMFIA